MPAAVATTVTQGSLNKQALTYAVVLLFRYSQSDVPKVTKSQREGSELGMMPLPLNRSQKSIALSLMGKLLNVVLASETECVGSPRRGTKLLKPGATELWCS